MNGINLMRPDRQRFSRDHYGDRWIISLNTFHTEKNTDQDFVCYSVWRNDKPEVLYLKAEDIDKFIHSLEFAKKQLEEGTT